MKSIFNSYELRDTQNTCFGHSSDVFVTQVTGVEILGPHQTLYVFWGLISQEDI